MHEYRAKIFKSGNSVALRLPRAFGLQHGDEVCLREDRGTYSFEPIGSLPRALRLGDLYGSVPNLERLPVDEVVRDWGDGSVSDAG